jgi:acyl carrier protein
VTTTTPVLDPTALREILVTSVGIDDAALTEEPHATLADLGLDSMAQVELEVVLRSRHGVQELPDDTSAMSFDELARRLCR